MTATRLALAVLVAVGLLGGVALVSAEAGEDRATIDWMHDWMGGDHADHHDGDHAAHHAAHHDGDHAAHHGTDGHCS